MVFPENLRDEGREILEDRGIVPLPATEDPDAAYDRKREDRDLYENE